MLLRKVSALGFIICLVVLAAAFYLEYEYMLATCPLCILQRIVFLAIGVICLLGTFIKISGNWRYVYCSSIAIFAALGGAIASRQIWLQYFAPPQPTSCAASLEQLISIYPFLEALQIALAGSGECATIDFTILGLSLAAWSLLLFLAIFVTMLGLIYMQKKRRI